MIEHKLLEQILITKPEATVKDYFTALKVLKMQKKPVKICYVDGKLLTIN